MEPRFWDKILLKGSLIVQARERRACEDLLTCELICDSMLAC